jgi:hypothetical protein
MPVPSIVPDVDVSKMKPVDALQVALPYLIPYLPDDGFARDMAIDLMTFFPLDAYALRPIKALADVLGWLAAGMDHQMEIAETKSACKSVGRDYIYGHWIPQHRYFRKQLSYARRECLAERDPDNAEFHKGVWAEIEVMKQIGLALVEVEWMFRGAINQLRADELKLILAGEIVGYAPQHPA